MASLVTSFMPRGQRWKLSRQPDLLPIWTHASRRHLIVVVSLRIPLNSGILWVLCGRHLVNPLHSMVSAFQLLWKRGKLTMCPLFFRHVKLLDIVVIFLLQEKGKRKCLGVQSIYRVNFEVPSPSVSSQKRAVIYDPNFAAALKTESLRGKNEWAVYKGCANFPMRNAVTVWCFMTAALLPLPLLIFAEQYCFLLRIVFIYRSQ